MAEENENLLLVVIAKVAKVAQVLFFLVVSCGTIYNAYFLTQQSRLIYKPVLGVVEVKTTRMFDKEDILDNIKAVKIDFIIENRGNLPAKNVRIKTTGKIGNTVLPYTESDQKEGIILIQNVKVTNTATISKDVLNKMIQEDEKLIYTVELSFSDWDNHDYGYASKFEIYVTNKEPLTLSTRMLP